MAGDVISSIDPTMLGMWAAACAATLGAAAVLMRVAIKFGTHLEREADHAASVAMIPAIAAGVEQIEASLVKLSKIVDEHGRHITQTCCDVKLLQQRFDDELGGQYQNGSAQ